MCLYTRLSCVLCILALIVINALSVNAANVYNLQQQMQLQHQPPDALQQPAPNVDVQLTDAGANNQSITWIQQMRLLRERVKNCVKQKQDTTWNCLKMHGARLFDGIMTANVIRIWPGVRLVRMLHATSNENATSALSEQLSSSAAMERKDLQHLTLLDRFAMRLAHTLSTHLLQINFKELTDAHMLALQQDANRSTTDTAEQLGTARHRRHRYNMMITMMFGVTALGAVLVPLGFQMLSIVSGKALLLAKMALLLASINGLKKVMGKGVANSGVHYGLYHVPSEHYGYYDRGDAPHHPRHVASFAFAQPITEELSIQ